MDGGHEENETWSQQLQLQIKHSMTPDWRRVIRPQTHKLQPMWLFL
jgi:hypothetical protein